MSGWIENRFPSHKQSVIVAVKTGLDYDVFDDHVYNSKLCTFTKKGEHSPTIGVTHWQPLPEPPKD